MTKRHPVIRWLAGASGRAARGVLGLAVSAMTWFLLLCIGGAASAVFGVYLVAGTGIACMVAGAFLLAGAALIYRGLSNG